MIKQLLTASVSLLFLSTPALASWPAEQADTFDSIGTRAALNPDTQIPESSSIRQACNIYWARLHVNIAVSKTNDNLISHQLDNLQAGLITEQQFQENIRPWHLSNVRVDRQYLAAQVGVMRTAGYMDWKMYSRYSLDGVGDLWRSNILKGDKVTDHPEHPHYGYTYRGRWSRTVSTICKPYE